jgi:hypothetical protein
VCALSSALLGSLRIRGRQETATAPIDAFVCARYTNQELDTDTAEMATNSKAKANGKVAKHAEEEHGYEFLGP